MEIVGTTKADVHGHSILWLCSIMFWSCLTLRMIEVEICIHYQRPNYLNLNPKFKLKQKLEIFFESNGIQY